MNDRSKWPAEFFSFVALVLALLDLGRVASWLAVFSRRRDSAGWEGEPRRRVGFVARVTTHYYLREHSGRE